MRIPLWVYERATIRTATPTKTSWGRARHLASQRSNTPSLLHFPSSLLLKLYLVRLVINLEFHRIFSLKLIVKIIKAIYSFLVQKFKESFVVNGGAFGGWCSIYQVRCHRSLFHSDSTLLRSLWRNSGLIVTWYIEHNPIWFVRTIYHWNCDCYN